MPIEYDEDAGTLVVGSESCEDCEGPLYDTGCDAPGCRGCRCDNCGTGCDLDLDPGGRCSTLLGEESGEDYTSRVNAGRAAFGLKPIDGK